MQGLPRLAVRPALASTEETDYAPRTVMQQRRLEPFRQRLRRAQAALFSSRYVKRQRVYLVTIGERRFKRTLFGDATKARRVAETLQAFSLPGIVPPYVSWYDDEVWVEFVEGDLVTAAESGLADELAPVLGRLYAHEARKVPQEERAADVEILANLAFLRDVGVLNSKLHALTVDCARAATPKEVWLGWDYGDLLPKNLIRDRQGVLRFIDIESIHRDYLIGLGLAKASLRWLGDRRSSFLTALAEAGAPPVAEYLPFLELHVLARLTKRSVLQDKPRHVDPEAFRRLVARS